uniref:Putative secreted protein n=1 Tax=Ixodes ricinus TaxID=34613 RepID=A0A6B0UJV0_IXORI
MFPLDAAKCWQVLLAFNGSAAGDDHPRALPAPLLVAQEGRVLGVRAVAGHPHGVRVCHVAAGAQHAHHRIQQRPCFIRRKGSKFVLAGGLGILARVLIGRRFKEGKTLGLH